MNVIDIKPRGYCKGVIRAIILAKKTRAQYPEEPITILGALVHNKYIVQALGAFNIKTVNNPHKTRLELLDEINEGIVIFSAHGVSEQVREKAKIKGLKVFDATCEDVQSTHEIVREAIENNKEVIYIGKENHAESLAVIETFPSVHFITKLEDVDTLGLDKEIPLLVTNQTTLSTIQIQKILDRITTIYPQAEIINEICLATQRRQMAVINQSNLDVLIVVGDPMSNNTAMLGQIGKDNGIKKIIKIESIEQLDLSQLSKGETIGITSGASTPNYLTNQVIDYLKEVDLDNPSQLPKIDYSRILD